MNEWVPIQYRDFWDVPHIFLATYRDKLYLFDCRFDETKEDYQSHFRVFEMSFLANDELTGSWHHVSSRALFEVGQVPVAEIRFDPSNRTSIDPAVFQRIGKAQPTETRSIHSNTNHNV